MLVLLVVVNVPVAASLWTQQRLSSEGTTVTTPAAVADPEGRLVEWQLPEGLLPEDASGGLATQVVQLEQEAFEEAAARDQVVVTYLEEDPGTYRVEGQDGRLGVVAALVGNAALLLVVGLFLVVRGRGRPELRLVAGEDLRRAAPDPLLQRLEGNEYLVRGDVEELEPDAVVLVVGDRRVRVDLAGHANPASYQQSVEVRGTMVG